MPVGAIGHLPVRYLMTRQRFRYDGDTHLPPDRKVKHEIVDCVVFAVADVFYHRPTDCRRDLFDFANHLTGLVARHHLGGVRLVTIQNRPKNQKSLGRLNPQYQSGL